jgi:hypothetical protein
MLKVTSAIAVALAFFATIANAQPAADPLANISRDVSVVLNPGPSGQLLLTEDDHGVTTTRTLGVGDEYADGWRIKTITGTSVTLAKDDKVRTMAILGRRPGAVQAAPTPVPAPPISASNAGAPGRAAAAPASSRAQLDASIAVGNVEQVKSLGGTPEEVARATATRNSGLARAENQAAQAAAVARDQAAQAQVLLAQQWRLYDQGAGPMPASPRPTPPGPIVIPTK